MDTFIISLLKNVHILSQSENFNDSKYISVCGEKIVYVFTQRMKKNINYRLNKIQFETFHEKYFRSLRTEVGILKLFRSGI